jgi:ABC transport system ATP-binding/permease protein
MAFFAILSPFQSLYSWRMSIEQAGRAGASTQLRVRAPGSDQVLDGAATYRIGRDPQADIVLADPRVSWDHAVLRHHDGGWLLEDSGSTNGTFVDRRRVQRVDIAADCSVRLGHPGDGPQLHCSLVTPEPERPATAKVQVGNWAQEAEPAAPPRVPAQRPPSYRPPSAVMQMPAKALRIGRASDNDVVVADLGVSRHHAELRRTARGEYEIVDLDSHNGTYLNGQRITAAPVTETDLIGVGPATFRRVGDQLQEFLDTGDISLSARDLTVQLPGGKVLLDRVSFPLGERCLLGVIGPSGAGKSTLLGALTGIAPATGGSVLYDGRDLYKSYAELRHRIGLVPQENILHTQLTVRRALKFAAELRFPRDTSKHERKRRIDEVLGELALTAHADTKTAALSGGQQKRVNVALELLTKPSLLFLDEPTSGLDPGLDKSVMEQMAELAHDGRTVIVVTHSVANLHLCDRLLVLVPGGKIAFFGPPADGLRHFGKKDWAEVFQAFEREPGRDWAREYRSSPYYTRYIANEMTGALAPPVAGRQAPKAPAARNRLSHLRTMIRRYLAVIGSDRLYLAMLAGLPVALGAMVRVIPAPHGLTGTDNVDATSLLLVLSVGACLSGAANAIWEIVKERPIYSRERAAGLSAGAYLMSKLLVLGLISGAQAVVLVLIGLTGRPLPTQGALLTHQPIIELMLAMFALGLASTVLGLLISSVVSTSDKAMPLLVVVVMFQVVLSGGIFALHGKVGLEEVAWLSPSRWGYAATASTSNLNHVIPPATPGSGNGSDPLWDHTASTWLTDIGILLGLALAFALLTLRRLIKMGPVKRG